MALQEYYNTGSNNELRIADYRYLGQSFTTAAAYTIESFKALVGKYGTVGTATFNLYATAAGVPTGAALATGTIDATAFNTLVTFAEEEYAWEIFTFDTPVALSISTLYAITIEWSGGDQATDFISWRRVAPGAYATGTLVYSDNNGSSWATGTSDQMFEIYSSDSIEYVDLEATIEDTSEILAALEIAIYTDLSATIEDTSEILATLYITTVPAVWPHSRYDEYDPDLYWDEEDGEWNSDRLTQPGSFTGYILAISEQGDIYFRAI